LRKTGGPQIEFFKVYIALFSFQSTRPRQKKKRLEPFLLLKTVLVAFSATVS